MPPTVKIQEDPETYRRRDSQISDASRTSSNERRKHQSKFGRPAKGPGRREYFFENIVGPMDYKKMLVAMQERYTNVKVSPVLIARALLREYVELCSVSAGAMTNWVETRSMEYPSVAWRNRLTPTSSTPKASPSSNSPAMSPMANSTAKLQKLLDKKKKPKDVDMTDYPYHERYQQLLHHRWLIRESDPRGQEMMEWSSQMEEFQVAFQDMAVEVVEQLNREGRVTFHDPQVSQGGNDRVPMLQPEDPKLEKRSSIVVGPRRDIVVMVTNTPPAMAFVVKSLSVVAQHQFACAPMFAPYAIHLQNFGQSFIVATAAPFIGGPDTLASPVTQQSPLVKEFRRSLAVASKTKGDVGIYFGRDGRLYVVDAVQSFTSEYSPYPKVDDELKGRVERVAKRVEAGLDELRTFQTSVLTGSMGSPHSVHFAPLTPGGGGQFPVTPSYASLAQNNSLAGSPSFGSPAGTTSLNHASSPTSSLAGTLRASSPRAQSPRSRSPYGFTASQKAESESGDSHQSGGMSELELEEVDPQLTLVHRCMKAESVPMRHLGLIYNAVETKRAKYAVTREMARRAVVFAFHTDIMPVYARSGRYTWHIGRLFNLVKTDPHFWINCMLPFIQFRYNVRNAPVQKVDPDTIIQVIGLHLGVVLKTSTIKGAVVVIRHPCPLAWLPVKGRDIPPPPRAIKVTTTVQALGKNDFAEAARSSDPEGETAPEDYNLYDAVFPIICHFIMCYNRGSGPEQYDLTGRNAIAFAKTVLFDRTKDKKVAGLVLKALRTTVFEVLWNEWLEVTEEPSYGRFDIESMTLHLTDYCDAFFDASHPHAIRCHEWHNCAMMEAGKVKEACRAQERLVGIIQEKFTGKSAVEGKKQDITQLEAVMSLYKMYNTHQDTMKGHIYMRMRAFFQKDHYVWACQALKDAGGVKRKYGDVMTDLYIEAGKLHVQLGLVSEAIQLAQKGIDFIDTVGATRTLQEWITETQHNYETRAEHRRKELMRWAGKQWLKLRTNARCKKIQRVGRGWLGRRGIQFARFFATLQSTEETRRERLGGELQEELWRLTKRCEDEAEAMERSIAYAEEYGRWVVDDYAILADSYDRIALSFEFLRVADEVVKEEDAARAQILAGLDSEQALKLLVGEELSCRGAMEKAEDEAFDGLVRLDSLVVAEDAASTDLQTQEQAAFDSIKELFESGADAAALEAMRLFLEAVEAFEKEEEANRAAVAEEEANERTALIADAQALVEQLALIEAEQRARRTVVREIDAEYETMASLLELQQREVEYRLQEVVTPYAAESSDLYLVGDELVNRGSVMMACYVQLDQMMVQFDEQSDLLIEALAMLRHTNYEESIERGKLETRMKVDEVERKEAAVRELELVPAYDAKYSYLRYYQQTMHIKSDEWVARRRDLRFAERYEYHVMIGEIRLFVDFLEMLGQLRHEEHVSRHRISLQWSIFVDLQEEEDDHRRVDIEHTYDQRAERLDDMSQLLRENRAEEFAAASEFFEAVTKIEDRHEEEAHIIEGEAVVELSALVVIQRQQQEQLMIETGEWRQFELISIAKDVNVQELAERDAIKLEWARTTVVYIAVAASEEMLERKKLDVLLTKTIQLKIVHETARIARAAVEEMKRMVLKDVTGQTFRRIRRTYRRETVCVGELCGRKAVDAEEVESRDTVQRLVCLHELELDHWLDRQHAEALLAVQLDYSYAAGSEVFSAECTERLGISLLRGLAEKELAEAAARGGVREEEGARFQALLEYKQRGLSVRELEILDEATGAIDDLLNDAETRRLQTAEEQEAAFKHILADHYWGSRLQRVAMNEALHRGQISLAADVEIGALSAQAMIMFSETAYREVLQAEQFILRPHRAAVIGYQEHVSRGKIESTGLEVVSSLHQSSMEMMTIYAEMKSTCDILYREEKANRTLLWRSMNRGALCVEEDIARQAILDEKAEDLAPMATTIAVVECRTAETTVRTMVSTKEEKRRDLLGQKLQMFGEYCSEVRAIEEEFISGCETLSVAYGQLMLAAREQEARAALVQLERHGSGRKRRGVEEIDDLDDNDGEEIAVEVADADMQDLRYLLHSCPGTAQQVAVVKKGADRLVLQREEATARDDIFFSERASLRYLLEMSDAFATLQLEEQEAEARAALKGRERDEFIPLFKALRLQKSEVTARIAIAAEFSSGLSTDVAALLASRYSELGWSAVQQGQIALTAGYASSKEKAAMYSRAMHQRRMIFHLFFIAWDRDVRSRYFNRWGAAQLERRQRLVAALRLVEETHSVGFHEIETSMLEWFQATTYAANEAVMGGAESCTNPHRLAAASGAVGVAVTTGLIHAHKRRVLDAALRQRLIMIGVYWQLMEKRYAHSLLQYWMGIVRRRKEIQAQKVINFQVDEEDARTNFMKLERSEFRGVVSLESDMRIEAEAKQTAAVVDPLVTLEDDEDDARSAMLDIEEKGTRAMWSDFNASLISARTQTALVVMQKAQEVNIDEREARQALASLEFDVRTVQVEQVFEETFPEPKDLVTTIVVTDAEGEETTAATHTTPAAVPSRLRRTKTQIIRDKIHRLEQEDETDARSNLHEQQVGDWDFHVRYFNVVLEAEAEKEASKRGPVGFRGSFSSRQSSMSEMDQETFTMVEELLLACQVALERTRNKKAGGPDGAAKPSETTAALSPAEKFRRRIGAVSSVQLGNYEFNNTIQSHSARIASDWTQPPQAQLKKYTKAFNDATESVVLELSRRNGAFASTATEVALRKKFPELFRLTPVSESDGGVAYVDVNRGAFFRVWNSAVEARRYVKSNRTLSQCLFDMHSVIGDSVGVPYTQLYCSAGAFITVTALFPALSETPFAAPTSESSGSLRGASVDTTMPLLRTAFTAVREALHLPSDFEFRLAPADDGRLYLVFSDILPHVVTTSYNAPHAGYALVSRMKIVPAATGISDHIKNTVLPAVALQLLQMAKNTSIPLADGLRERVVSKAMHRHGGNMTFLYRLLVVPSLTVKGQDISGPRLVRSLIMSEMALRALRDVAMSDTRNCKRGGERAQALGAFVNDLRSSTDSNPVFDALPEVVRQKFHTKTSFSIFSRFHGSTIADPDVLLKELENRLGLIQLGRTHNFAPDVSPPSLYLISAARISASGSSAVKEWVRKEWAKVSSSSVYGALANSMHLAHFLCGAAAVHHVSAFLLPHDALSDHFDSFTSVTTDAILPPVVATVLRNIVVNIVGCQIQAACVHAALTEVKPFIMLACYLFAARNQLMSQVTHALQPAPAATTIQASLQYTIDGSMMEGEPQMLHAMLAQLYASATSVSQPILQAIQTEKKKQLVASTDTNKAQSVDETELDERANYYLPVVEVFANACLCAVDAIRVVDYQEQFCGWHQALRATNGSKASAMVTTSYEKYFAHLSTSVKNLSTLLYYPVAARKIEDIRVQLGTALDDVVQTVAGHLHAPTHVQRNDLGSALYGLLEVLFHLEHTQHERLLGFPVEPRIVEFFVRCCWRYWVSRDGEDFVAGYRTALEAVVVSVGTVRLRFAGKTRIGARRRDKAYATERFAILDLVEKAREVDSAEGSIENPLTTGRFDLGANDGLTPQPSKRSLNSSFGSNASSNNSSMVASPKASPAGGSKFSATSTRNQRGMTSNKPAPDDTGRPLTGKSVPGARTGQPTAPSKGSTKAPPVQSTGKTPKTTSSSTAPGKMKQVATKIAVASRLTKVSSPSNAQKKPQSKSSSLSGNLNSSQRGSGTKKALEAARSVRTVVASGEEYTMRQVVAMVSVIALRGAWRSACDTALSYFMVVNLKRPTRRTILPDPFREDEYELLHFLWRAEKAARRIKNFTFRRCKFVRGRSAQRHIGVFGEQTAHRKGIEVMEGWARNGLLHQQEELNRLNHSCNRDQHVHDSFLQLEAGARALLVGIWAKSVAETLQECEAVERQNIVAEAIGDDFIDLVAGELMQMSEMLRFTAWHDAVVGIKTGIAHIGQVQLLCATEQASREFVDHANLRLRISYINVQQHVQYTNNVKLAQSIEFAGLLERAALRYRELSGREEILWEWWAMGRSLKELYDKGKKDVRKRSRYRKDVQPLGGAAAEIELQWLKSKRLAPREDIEEELSIEKCRFPKEVVVSPAKGRLPTKGLSPVRSKASPVPTPTSQSAPAFSPSAESEAQDTSRRATISYEAEVSQRRKLSPVKARTTSLTGNPQTDEILTRWLKAKRLAPREDIEEECEFERRKFSPRLALLSPVRRSSTSYRSGDGERGQSPLTTSSPQVQFGGESGDVADDGDDTLVEQRSNTPAPEYPEQGGEEAAVSPSSQLSTSTSKSKQHSHGVLSPLKSRPSLVQRSSTQQKDIGDIHKLWLQAKRLAPRKELPTLPDEKRGVVKVKGESKGGFAGAGFIREPSLPKARRRSSDGLAPTRTESNLSSEYRPEHAAKGVKYLAPLNKKA